MKEKSYGMSNMMLEKTRKGPWTDHEDFLLANVVTRLGDRQWDFVAKHSGLNRTGKSCRLRWVNYLHPGLNKEKMTSTEERHVLELHTKWGNRWSRIARQLPGRTDNEIKNYWRTQMRKKAQERKQVQYRLTKSSEASSSSSHTHCDSGSKPEEEEGKRMKIDEIWKDIDVLKETITPLNDGYNKLVSCSYSYEPLVAPMWEYDTDSIWKLDAEYTMMPPPSGNYFQA